MSTRLTKKENSAIRKLLERHFTAEGVRCYLFGSAVKNELRASSDIDLLIISDRDERTRVSLFREELEESNITRNVDVVWYKDAPESLLEKATNEGILLWKN